MRALRLLYALVIAGLFVLVSAPPAQAAFGIDDCKSAPIPEAPGRGISGFFTPSDPPQTKGPSWAHGAPVYEKYGQAGLTFQTYDLGCGPDVGRDPGAVVSTTFANWILELPKFGVAAAGALLNAAYHPTYLTVFNPLLRTATHALRVSLFDKWVPLTLAVIGLILLARSSRMAFAHAAVTLAWALLIMVIAMGVFNYPVKAGSAADASVGKVLGDVNTGINGQGSVKNPANAAAGALSNAVLFEQWKMGTFGRSNSATADKYAKAIYTGQALTYNEAKLVRTDPDGAGKRLLDKKAYQWEDAAAQVKKTDPDAYQYLTGHQGGGRIAAAFVAFFAAACSVPFPIVGSLLMIGAFLIIRLAVVFFPAVAVVGIAYEARGVVKGVGTVVAAALINVVMFGVGEAITILAIGLLLAPTTGLPLWLALALMGVFSFIMWVAMKPLRRLTTMASPSRFFGDAAGAVSNTAHNAVSQGVEIGKQAVAAYTGTSIALDHHDNDEDKDSPTEGYTAPPPPTVEPSTAPEPSTPPPDRPALPAATDHAPSTPLAAPPPTPSSPSDPAPVFVPAAATTDIPEDPLPPPVEPQIDVDTGDEVYLLFDPDESDQV